MSLSSASRVPRLPQKNRLLPFSHRQFSEGSILLDSQEIVHGMLLDILPGPAMNLYCHRRFLSCTKAAYGDTLPLNVCMISVPVILSMEYRLPPGFAIAGLIIAKLHWESDWLVQAGTGPPALISEALPE